jgi:hypothetical protein
VQRLEDVDELLAQAVLERRAPAVQPPRHQQHLFVLDVDALDRTDALREVEDLRLAEGLGGEPAAVTLPDHRRVEALLDRGPDRERRREVVALDGQVGAVASAELVDGAEQGVGGVPGEDVGQPRLDPHAHQCQPPGGGPVVGHRELLVAKLQPGLGVRVLRMRRRQAHRHVEVVGARRQGAPEDRHDEPGVDGVQHVRHGVLADQCLDRGLVGGVDLCGDETVVADRRHGLVRPCHVVVGDHTRLEEAAPADDGGERRPDATGSGDQNAHAQESRFVMTCFTRV